MTHICQIRLLGSIQIETEGGLLQDFRSRKALALLAYLARHKQPVARSHLADLLWGDQPEARGRRNLSRELTYLSSHLPGCFEVDYYSVQFKPTATCWVDTSAFDELAPAPQPARSESGQPKQTKPVAASWLPTASSTPKELEAQAARLTEAVALYRGDFMAGFYLDGCPEFEMWLLGEQEAWRQRVTNIFDCLTVYYGLHRRENQALLYAKRWLELEPWQEVAHQHLMRLLARTGQRSAALAQYETCRRVLADELGVEPAAETIELYEQIRTGELGTEARSRAEISLTIQTPSPSVPLPPSPYRGLSAFQEEDALLFFGRETFTERLIEAVQQHPLVTVVGPSGSGKSSVVFAGLLPHLRTAREAETTQGTWLIASFRPGSHPFYALAGALLPLLEPELSETEQLVETRKLAEVLSRGELPLADIVARIQHKQRGADRLLLLVDQFEELFTLCPEAEIRQCFVDSVLSLITGHWSLVKGQKSEDNRQGTRDQRPRTTLLLTLRAGFLGQALTYRPLADALQNADVKLGPMTRQELNRAIEKPARTQGVAFEAGLVERILDDVGHQPGHLPLLEFALTALWEQQAQAGGHLNHAAYETIGRVQGALAHYADRVYAGLSKTEQAQARRVFAQMVQPGEGTADTRRLATRTELGEADWMMACRLADTRLVVTDRDSTGQETVEVVHESLIQRWGRLQAWLNEDRAFRIWQERLRTALRQWEANDWDEEALLRGALLAEAEAWLQSRADDLVPRERLFVEASVALRNKRLQEAEAQRQHELAQAQALAEAERQRAEAQTRASKWLRWLTTGLAVMFLLAVVAVVLAISQRQEAHRQATTAVAAQATAEAERSRAEQQARLSLSRQLAAQAVSLVDEQLDLSLLLSLEASRLANSAKDVSDLLVSLKFSPFLNTMLQGHTTNVLSVAFSPDGKILASGSGDNIIILWDVTTGRPIAEPLRGHTDWVTSIAFSPDGQTLASAGKDERIILWDVTTREPKGAPLIGPAMNIAFSPDGQTIASVSDGVNDITLWDVPTRQQRGELLKGHTDWISAVAFSPDGQILASASKDTTIILWNTATGEPLGPPLKGHTDWVLRVAFSPDGQILASGSLDKSVILWDVATGQPLLDPLVAHQARIYALAFSPDGKTLASGSGDHSITLWDVTNPETDSVKPLSSSLIGHTNWVRSLSFSPDGKTLASGGHDGNIILWDLEVARFLNGHTAPVRGVDFSPDSQALASGGLDQTVILWDVAAGQPVGRPLTGHTDLVLNVAFSPDGRTLASVSSDKTMILWDVATKRPLGPPLTGHTDWLTNVAFSPDGQTVATSSADGTVILWDVATQQPLGPPLTGHSDWVLDVTFSPDGQMLASSGQDSSIILWDVATGEAIGSPFTEHTNWVLSLAFSPDGKILASGSADNTIILRDVMTREVIGTPLTGHTARIWGVLFHPLDNGQILVSGSADGTIILWDVATGQPLGPPIFGNTEMETIELSPDGQTLVMGSFGKSVILWKLNLEDWSTRACQIANRNLTQVEWEEFIGPGLPYQRTCPNLPSGP